MKLLYITNIEIDAYTDIEADGVIKKIFQQIELLKKAGFDVEYSYYNRVEKTVCLQSDGKKIILGINKFIKTLTASWCIGKYVKKKFYACVYIRNFTRKDPFVLHLLKNLKKNGSKIVYELPTYPYDNQANTFSAKIDLFIDKIFRKNLYRYVDRIATFSEHESIWKIPTINIMNGIILDGFSPVLKEKSNSGIHLLGIAYMQMLHGYERIIEGMADYIRKGGNSVYVHLVGEGKEKQKYIELVQKFHLQEYVKFYPKMSGTELDEMYEVADMALIHFGLYKLDVSVSSALKSKESMAKGIPIISGSRVDVCEKVFFPYFCQFPNTKEPIDIFEIEKFYYEKIQPRGKLVVANEIRNYAKKYVDMAVTFKPVIEFFLE